jgi:hypothetical protein
VTTARRLIALLSVLFLVPLIAVTAQSSSASAADDNGLFQPLSGFRPSGSTAVRPVEYQAYRADLSGLRAQLAGTGSKRLSIPDPAGTDTEFTVVEDSVMAPSMQAAHPDIRTYAGSATNGTTIRLDITPLGFHAMVRRPDGVIWYVEPATGAVGESRVLSFAGAAVGDPGSTFVEQEVRRTTDKVAAEAGDTDFSTPGGIVSQRTYRLALVTDPAYAAYVAPGATTHAVADPLVLAAKTTLINRVNEAYNDDVAYKFTLIAGTDSKLNLLTTAEMSGANGPCGASACFPDATGAYSCDEVLERNPFALGMLVGADKFDLGHIGVGVNGGGVAGLGVVGTADKAIGCTGVPTPVGDLYAIDYVAHEMGHQMGGNHTFNGTTGSCAGGNRHAATSVEPGSGVTIMAYAGICSTNDLQPHSDPYFSFKSIQEFEANAAGAPGNELENQVVALKNFEGVDSFTLTGSAGTSSPVVNGTSYNAVGLAAAVLAASGTPATITGYDGAGAPDASGFTASWGSTADQQTLTVTPVAGASSATVGTIVNGGPDTNGGTVTATANHSPVVTAPAAKSIPTRTPFTLTGSATDADSDTLTYMWEQTDNGVAGTSLVSNTKLNGPLFRVFGTYADVSGAGTILYNSPGENLAGTDPSRTFPDIAQIAAVNTNAATGSCPAAGSAPVAIPIVNCYSEFLPTSAYVGTGDRVMHFRLTARDEFAADGAADHPGGVSWADTAITVDNTAGPLLVTSRSSAGAPATGGGSELVTWNVAGTAVASLAPNVKISLSTDGGLTYPTVLSASTSNDGSESVTLPNLSTTTARIKVEAVGNYFFAINDANFAITGTNVAPTVNAGPDASVIVSQPFVSSGSFTDDNPSGATATVDYGDGSGVQPLTFTGTAFNLNHTYATPGAKTVTVSVTDSAAVTIADTAQVTVTANLAPVVNAGPDGPAVTGVEWTSSGTFTDELPDAATGTVDYGDGAGPVPLTLGEGTFDLSHTYSTGGAKTVTVKVTDGGTLFGTDTATVTVGAPPNTAPTVDAGPDASISAGATFTSSGTFNDDHPESVTATVDYGDGGGPVALTLDAIAKTFSLSHVYATAGSKTVTVKVTDAGTLNATDTATVTVTGSNNPVPAASVTKGSANPKKITKGKGFKAVVTVTTASGVPAGTVQIYKGSKLLGTGILANGTVTIKVAKKVAKKFKVGKVTLTAKYLGSATVAASQVDFKIKVKKKP